MRLFGIARLCEYRGGRSPPRRLSVPSPFRLGCFGLIACVLCVAARPFLMPSSVPAASRSPLRPIRYDKRSGCLRVILLLARRGVGRVGRAVSSRLVSSRLVMAIMRPLRLLSPCVPLIARRRAALRIAATRPLRFLMVLSFARSHHACDTLSPRPSTRETGSGTGRGLARCCEISDVRRFEKSGRGCLFPRPLVRASIGCHICLGCSRSDSVAC